jgi:hypothetical protein
VLLDALPAVGHLVEVLVSRLEVLTTRLLQNGDVLGALHYEALVRESAEDVEEVANEGRSHIRLLLRGGEN